MGFWTPWGAPIKLAVHERGYGDTPLVLIHGWGLGGHVWEPCVPLLDMDFRIFVVSLAGHGGSPPWPPRAGLPQMAEAVAAAVPTGGIWVGWSLGGLVALEAAAGHRGQVAGLCLVATNPRFVAGPEWSNGVDPAVFETFRALLRTRPEAARRRFAALLVTNAAERRLVGTALAREPAWQAAGQRLLAPLEILARADLVGRLEHIPQPVEWLLGDDDQLVPAGLAGALGHRCPQWGVHTVHGGHAFFTGRPRVLAQTVERLRRQL